MDFIESLKVSEEEQAKNYDIYIKERRRRELDKEIWKIAEKKKAEQQDILETNREEIRY